MALKENSARACLEQAAGKIIETSLCEISGGWLALVETTRGRRLACAYAGECAAAGMFVKEQSASCDGVTVDVMELNPNNAAVVRRFVKWAAPSACGVKGSSVGFSDWLGSADAFAAPLFAKRMLKPVLVDYSADDSACLERTFLAAVDTATWGVLAAGYKEGYGANAAGLRTEEDIVKALLYGYSMIGFDCSEKINLEIEKLTDEAVEKKYNDFNADFRKALQASYLDAEFQVGADKVSFTPAVLRRIVLEYGEAIMHVQFIYNSYLKNTPWDIDFELNLSKPGKLLTPQEHYLIANELQRNGVKLSSICLDALYEEKALHEDLQLHCAIADTFGYRLSFCNADLVMEEPAVAQKYLKGKVHFKLTNTLWLAALQLLAEQNAALFAKIAGSMGLTVCSAEELTGTGAVSKAYALGYKQALSPKQGDLAGEVKEYLQQHSAEYAKYITKNVEKFIKKL